MNTSSNSLSLTHKKLLHFFFSKEKKGVIILLILITLSGLIPSIDSLFIQNFTDTIESFTDKNSSDLKLPQVILKWVILYGIWWEGLNILWRTYDYVYLKTLPNIKAQVIDEYYDYVQYHSHNFFQNNLAGALTNRITEGARSLEMIFAFITEKIIRKASVLMFALATMYTVHSIIANIFLVWLIFFVGVSLYFSKTINNYSTAYGRNKALVAGKIVDAIANISIIRMFTSHRFERSYLRSHLNKTIQSEQKMQWFMFKLRYVLGISCTLMIGSMIYYIFILRSELAITIGQAVLIITLCLAVAEDIWDLTQEFGDLFEEIGAFNQTITLLENYIVKDAEDAKPIDFKEPTIEFRNVTFNYHYNNIFKNKSVTILAKQKVGLAGFSGSGKTTFTHLITRLFDIDKGKILISGQDIKTVTQESLRKNISIIPQEPILFHRTILENIKYGKEDATIEEVIAAAKATYIHDFITKLPDGYNTLCGERGNNLSGGQRQRIIIARAILKNAPILILDEATSALDSHTESLIQKSLHKLMNGKTVLVIAHRLSTLLHMDRILVFDNGYIVEDGTHQELKNNGKTYQKLWETQIGKNPDKIS